MKGIIALFYCLIAVITQNVFGQQNDVRYDVKIKPGNAIHCFEDNNYTAIASSKDILIVNNATGIVNKTFAGHTGAVYDLDSNPKGDLLVSSSKDNTAIIWDFNSGTIVQKLNGHSKSVLAAGFIDDTKVVTISEDNSLRIWDPNSGKVIGTFSDHKGINTLATNENYIITGDKEGLIVIRATKGDSIYAKVNTFKELKSLALNVTGKYLYAGFSNGDIFTIDIGVGRIVGQINNGKGAINDLFVTHDNEHLVVSARGCSIYGLNNMSLIKKIDEVSSAVLTAKISPDGHNLYYIEEFAPKAICQDVTYLNIAYAVNMKDDADKTPPQLYLSSPAKIVDDRVIIYDPLLKINGSVIDDYGVQLLKINGIETPMKDNGNFVINVPLTMGDNFITMEITDINQNTTLKKFIVTRKNLSGVDDYDPAEGKNYLLVIGINKYEYWPQLYNAVKDANDVAKILVGMYNYEFSDITLLTDELATRSNLYSHLRDYVSKIGPNDNLMIYYSGHGYFDQTLNEGYWVPSDARINETGDYLSNSDISKIIGNINSQHTFLVADACFSGSLFNTTTRGYAENVEKYRSRWGLTSGRLETVSDGEIGKNSPFATAFIDYLKNQPLDKLTVSQIVQEVKIRVSEVADQTPIGSSLRGVGDEGGEFVFYKKE
jgi:hypothetical protein